VSAFSGDEETSGVSVPTNGRHHSEGGASTLKDKSWAKGDKTSKSGARKNKKYLNTFRKKKKKEPTSPIPGFHRSTSVFTIPPVERGADSLSPKAYTTRHKKKSIDMILPGGLPMMLDEVRTLRESESEGERERESVCVCTRERERKREREVRVGE
jgi:hypothetical protein